MTLIEAARTMLPDSLLPTVFWAEVVNTACYVLNKVLVTKPHNKTPYELIMARPPSISFMRPFGCLVTILNTIDPLGKFDGKAEEGFLVGYSVNSKAFRVFNSQTRKVEENMHVNFLENKLNVVGQGPNWIFDIDSLTNSMNYQPVTAGNQTNKNAGPQETNVSENVQALKNVLDKMIDQEKEAKEQSDAIKKIGDAGSSFVPLSKFINLPYDPLMPDLEDTAEVPNTGIFGSTYDADDLDTCNSPYANQVVGAEADFNNMESSTFVSHFPITRVHFIHPKDQIIGDPRRRPKWDTKLPQTSVPQDLGADEAILKEGLTGMDKGGSPRCQDTMRVLLLKLVLDLEKEKDAQVVKILRLTKRVKRLEIQRTSFTSQPRRRKYRQVESSDDDLDEEDASKQGRSNDKTEPISVHWDFTRFIRLLTYSPKALLRGAVSISELPRLGMKSYVPKTLLRPYGRRKRVYTMADMNIPANDALAVQVPTVAPPTRTDDQILPLSKWVTIGKSNCLDKQWFNLHKDILRDALDITPANDNNPFMAPPSSDIVIEYVNTLGYPSTLRNVSAMSVNALYQPWRAILSMINMCLTGKTAGYDRPRHPTFLTDRKNLATAARGKKKIAYLFIPSVRFTKLIIHHLRTKHNIHPMTGSPLHYSHEESILNTLRFVRNDGREIFGMPIPDALLTDEIKGAPYYGDYQEHVAKYQQFLDTERGKAKEGGATESSEATKVTKPKASKVTKPAGDKAPKPTATQPPKPKPAPTQPSKAPKSPLKLVDEPSDEGVHVEDPVHTDDEADLQRALELSLKEQAERTQGPACLVVLREPEFGKYQPLPEVQGKGKEKVVNEQAAHDLLTLQTPMKMSLVDQFIFQRSPPIPIEPTGHADSPSLDIELALTDSEMELDEEVPVINAADQDEDQAGPNPGEQDEGQAGPNPGIQDEGQAGSNPVDAVESQPLPSHVVHVGPNLEHMDIEATNASTQQKPEQMDEEFTTTAYLNVQENLKLSTEDQPHNKESEKMNAETEVQSMVSVPIHQDTSSVPPMTTLVIDLTTMQSDSPLPTSTETTSIITTKHRRSNPSKSHSQAVDEIVTGAVDWAMQAPLRARFRDLPTVDIKEILQQQMFEDNSYKAHEEEARKKKIKKHATPRTPSGSPPSPPPPLPPPAGASSALSISGASRSSQLPPPPHLPSIGTSGSAQQQGSKAPSSSKPAASIYQSMAWTTSDTRFKSSGFMEAQELYPTDSLMQDDSIPDEQVHLSDDEDSMNDHLPKVNSRQDWWKPIPEEERPMTPEPAWTIPSSNTGDMETFMKWYCQQVNKIKLTQAYFEGHAYEVVKAFYPDVIHLQFQMEECHKMLTAQVDWMNPEGDQVRIDVNRPLPLDGPPSHVTIQPQFFFNNDLEYLRYGSKGSNPALSISKMKAASYPDFGLELLKFYIDRHDSSSHRKDVRTHMRILSVVRIKAYSRYGFDYLSEIVLRRADFQEHTIAEKDFKNLYPNDFEDLNLLLLQGHLDHLPGSDMLNLTKPGWDATGYEFKHDYTITESPQIVVFPVNNNERKIMRFNEIYKFSDGTLTHILEALDYRVKEFKATEDEKDLPESGMLC
ncbi:retrovirus-related pol polyprotein from transposon TNT 1-94 [Tanacetum coccineum]